MKKIKKIIKKQESNKQEDKKTKVITKVRWLEEPNDGNYPAAKSYLDLIIDPNTVDLIVDRLKNEKIQHFKAKDIFRASRLSLLGISNSHVKKNIKKISEGIKMSPILLVRNTRDNSVIIADGYHRMCATYTYSEDEDIPCKITNI